MAKKVLTYNLSAPIGGATTAKVDLDMLDGNLLVDDLINDESVLTSGALQYLENQVQPTPSVTVNGGKASFAIKASGKGQAWFRLPWAACNGATEWQIHLNPRVSLDITAHTGGGNIALNLIGLAITRVTAETGGGNMEIILPDIKACLSVAAKTGAGNVAVRLPSGLAARIHATSGLGKVIVDSRFNKVGGNTYQSPDYESAINKVDMTLSSGAGNVTVEESIVQYEAAPIHI